MKVGLKKLSIILYPLFLLMTAPAFAEDIEAKLSTSDTNSAFTVKKADGSPVFKVRGDGSVIVPGINKNQRDAISSPSGGMLLYQTDNAPGFYYSDGSQWKEISSQVLLDPVNAAVSMAFTDTDGDANQLAGEVSITKASNESDLTHYVLYWGSSSTTRLAGDSVIATLSKTGNNLTHTFAENTNLPVGTTHILVFTKNDNGEMLTGINIAIGDNKPIITVTDNQTGLMWQDNDYTGLHNWNDAISYCDNLNLDGYSDWRLPSLSELSDLGSYPKWNILGSYVWSFYWSSTSSISGAHGVYFDHGYAFIHDKSQKSYVRCVRGG
ncbi:DUF1566 domain-containing protein [Deltaproteobacteria bacterium TL4]